MNWGLVIFIVVAVLVCWLGYTVEKLKKADRREQERIERKARMVPRD